MNFDDLFHFDNNNIIINIKYFKKQKDYKKLVEYILLQGSRLNLKYNLINVFIIMNDINKNEIDINFAKNMADLLPKFFDRNKLNNCYLINFPTGLKSIYLIICGFIDKQTKSKIKFLKIRDFSIDKIKNDPNLSKYYEKINFIENENININNVNNINNNNNQFVVNENNFGKVISD